MTDTSHKIIIEFSLTPSGKQKLEKFFDSNFEKLQREDEEAQANLQTLLRQVLPVESQKSLRTLFKGDADYALLIGNLPERKGLEDIAANLGTRDAYCTHISKALYEMFDAQPYKPLLVKRSRERAFFAGGELHRDNKRDRFACLSAPYNGEQAPTRVVNLSAALESIPTQDRQLMIADVLRIRHDESTFSRPTNMNGLLTELNDPTLHFVTKLEWIKPDNLRSKFNEALDAHGQWVTLQPGQILIFDEAHIFHSSAVGDVTLVPPTAQRTRILLRYSGEPLETAHKR